MSFIPLLQVQLTQIRSYSVAREARFLKKLVTGTSHTRKKWYIGGEHSSKALKDLSFMMAGPGGEYKSTGNEKLTSGRKLRRAGVLSTVFMEQITSLLATGEVSTEIPGCGLEITQIKMSSDFTCINVYWYSSSDSENGVKLESTLKGIAGKLRHVLSQLRVIGQVPPIVFVKDNKHIRLLEVENILAKIDFGGEYIPTPLGQNYKTVMSSHKSSQSNFSVSAELKSKIESLEIGGAELGRESEPEESDDSLQSPGVMSSKDLMRQDLLGLNWEKIMGKVKLEVTKTRLKQNRQIEQTQESRFDFDTPRSTAEMLEEVTQNVNRQKEFLEFLKQRRILRAKEEKRLSTEATERKFLEEERRSRWVEERGLDIHDPEEPEDYLPEDFSTHEIDKTHQLDLDQDKQKS